MITSKDLKRNFSASIDAAVSINNFDSVDNLAYLGFPNLYQISLFISDPIKIKQLANNRLNCPDICCQCGKVPVEYFATHHRHGLLGASKKNGPAMPYYQQHRPVKLSNILVLSTALSDWIVKVVVVGPYSKFLFTLLEMNRELSCHPPWRVFPDIACDSSAWRQGEIGQWYDTEWIPFWESLTGDEKRHFLEEKNASADWISRLNTIG